MHNLNTLGRLGMSKAEIDKTYALMTLVDAYGPAMTPGQMAFVRGDIAAEREIADFAQELAR